MNGALRVASGEMEVIMSSRSEWVNVTELFRSMCATFGGCSCAASHSPFLHDSFGKRRLNFSLALGVFLLLPWQLSAVAWTVEPKIRMEMETAITR